jgi:hypothetical protein
MKTLDCGGCGATLDVAALAPGTEFACGGCGANLKVPAGRSPAPAAPAGRPAARSPAKAAAAAPARASRSRERASPAAGAPPASKKGLLVAGIAVGAVVLVGVAFAMKRKPAPPAPPAEPVPVLAPKKPAGPPPKPETPEEASWKAAKTEADRAAVAESLVSGASGSDEAAKALYQFFVAKGRVDFAKKAAAARLAAEPDSPWACETLGRLPVKAKLEEWAARPELADWPHPSWERLQARLDGKRWYVDPGEDRKAWDEDSSALQKHLAEVSDPWYAEAAKVVREIRADKRFERFGPIDVKALPPYLVLAQHQNDPRGHQTVNVINNHVKFFQCLTGEFLKMMGEAGLATPTIKEMGNPVLKAFLFTDRNAFDRWHWDQGWQKNALRGIRAYYAWGSDQFMMMYDTGAPSGTQDEDTCTAFHEATHQLVHYYRRYYLQQQDRAKDPAAPEVSLVDPRLHGRAHWFGEGFAEFFGAADRISSQTGEWRLFRPYLKRMGEWGDPIKRGDAQWTLKEILEMTGGGALALLAKKKAPDRFEEFQSLYYAQAWSLNHMLYNFQDGKKYRARFLKAVSEEMQCRSGAKTFFAAMGVGEGDERKAFLEDLEADWIDHQRSLLKKHSGR